MKKSLILTAVVLFAGGGAFAPSGVFASSGVFTHNSVLAQSQGVDPESPSERDSVRTHHIDQVSVTAFRADDRTPVAHTDLSREDIERVAGSGVDIPFILTATPSVVATSDAGTGIGYTSLSIRGTDGTRINVTANGVPLGDAESHKLYWVNVPDFATSAGDIQIQRGVGTSTNGAGAFGGSVNIATEPFSMRPFAEISGGYGSWNTHRESIRFGTGLFGGGAGENNGALRGRGDSTTTKEGTGRWAFTGRLSNIGSDGYVDRASADLKSYFAQAGYFGRTTTVKLISFGGREETYHAWNGLTREQIARHGRRYNTAGEMFASDRFGREVQDADGNPVLEGFYPDQKDFYTQYNVQLIVDQRLAARWNLTLTGHYTRGDGYYEEFKGLEYLPEYGLEPYTIPDGEGGEATVENSDLVRRKKMWNNFAGAIASVTYSGDRLSAAFGGAWNRYRGDHFGQVVWIKNYVGDGTSQGGGTSDFRPNHEYYRNSTTKDDASVFAKVSWTVARGLSLWGDLQYRHISHRIGGVSDIFDWRSGVEAMMPLQVAREFDFFNPKAGLWWDVDDRHALYASFGVAHKEPTRNNYTEVEDGARPRAERLMDVELGYKLAHENISAGVNLYYMNYRDQLVMTGELNEVGEALTANVPKSFRAGVELTFGWQIARWFRWDIFGTFSLNRILDHTDFLHDEAGVRPVLKDFRGTTSIAFSPAITAGNIFTFNVRGFYGALQTNYVGKQYLTNAQREELSLPGYCVTNLRASYRFGLPRMKYLELGVTVANIFNSRYESSGWGASSVTYEDGAGGGSGSGDVPVRHDYSGFFPQATISASGTITLSF